MEGRTEHPQIYNNTKVVQKTVHSYHGQNLMIINILKIYIFHIRPQSFINETGNQTYN